MTTSGLFDFNGKYHLRQTLCVLKSYDGWITLSTIDGCLLFNKIPLDTVLSSYWVVLLEDKPMLGLL